MFTNDIDIKRVRNKPMSFNIKAFVVVFVKMYVSECIADCISQYYVGNLVCLLMLSLLGPQNLRFGNL